MKNVFGMLVSEQTSNRSDILKTASRKIASPSPRPPQGPANRLILIFLGLLTLTSCFDQVLIPDVDADGRLTVTNDEAILGERLSYLEDAVPIDPGSSPSPALLEGASAPPTASSVELTLVAELESPVVNGQVVQATSVSARRRFAFLISYNTQGSPFIGAVDYVINPFGVSPRLVSSVEFSDSYISAVGLNDDDDDDDGDRDDDEDDDWIYVAEATAAVGFATPATIERLTVAPSGILLENNARFDLSSFAATSVLTVDDVIYVTTGDGGHVYALDESDMRIAGQLALDDARWVAHDEDNDRIVVVQGTPGRISVFEEDDDFPGGSMTLLNTFPFPGADVPQSKSTVEVVGGKAFIAAGPEGVQVMCLDNGAIVGSVPRPDPAALGLDPSVVVTNAVTVDEDLMFISNGEAGVYVAAGAADFDSTPCAAPQNITMLGHLRFDDLQSVNHVDYENKRLLIAAGLGGLKIVKVKINK